MNGQNVSTHDDKADDARCSPAETAGLFSATHCHAGRSGRIHPKPKTTNCNYRRLRRGKLNCSFWEFMDKNGPTLYCMTDINPVLQSLI